MGEEGRKRKNLTAPSLLFSPARGEKMEEKNFNTPLTLTLSRGVEREKGR
jgi:hypothetical protein